MVCLEARNPAFFRGPEAPHWRCEFGGACEKQAWGIWVAYLAQPCRSCTLELPRPECLSACCQGPFSIFLPGFTIVWGSAKCRLSWVPGPRVLVLLRLL